MEDQNKLFIDFVNIYEFLIIEKIFNKQFNFTVNKKYLT